jgi:hypothetical protein
LDPIPYTVTEWSNLNDFQGKINEIGFKVTTPGASDAKTVDGTLGDYTFLSHIIEFTNADTNVAGFNWVNHDAINCACW